MAVSEAADQTAKIKTASMQQVLEWIVTAWEMIKDKKELIAKSFQTTGITSTDPAVVWNDEILWRALEEVQKDLLLPEEDGDEEELSEDPFADFELEDWLLTK